MISRAFKGAVTRVKTLVQGRSWKWPAVRRAHLLKHPECAACAKIDFKNEVHHIVPFKLDPSRELDASNLITLCDRHHLTFGHFENYSTYNPNVRTTAENYRTEKELNTLTMRR